MINMKARADAAVILTGALAALIGGVAMLGHALAVGALLQPFHAATPMVLPVALCIMVGGAALVLEGSGAAFPKALLAVGALMAGTTNSGRTYGLASQARSSSRRKVTSLAKICGDRFSSLE